MHTINILSFVFSVFSLVVTLTLLGIYARRFIIGWRADREARNWRRWILGFDSQYEVAPGSTMKISAKRTSLPFMAERLMIPAAVADHFKVHTICVDGNDILHATMEGPGERQFDAGMPANAINMTHLGFPVGRDYMVVIENVSDHPARFVMNIMGAVRDLNKTGQAADRGAN